MLSTSPVVHRDQQHYVCCENSLWHWSIVTQKYGAATLHRVTLNHHHHSGLVGDVAVPVSARQVVLSCAFLNPDARPRLNGRRSASTVLSQVCLGRPRRRFQFLGLCHMHALRAQEWSWDLSARATWPNSLRRLARTISDSKGTYVGLNYAWQLVVEKLTWVQACGEKIQSWRDLITDVL